MTRSKPLHVGIGIALAILFTVTTSSLEAGWHHAPVQRAAHASSGGSSGGSSGHCHGGLVRGLLGSLHQHLSLILQLQLHAPLRILLQG